MGEWLGFATVRTSEGPSITEGAEPGDVERPAAGGAIAPERSEGSQEEAVVAAEEAPGPGVRERAGQGSMEILGEATGIGVSAAMEWGTVVAVSEAEGSEMCDGVTEQRRVTSWRPVGQVNAEDL